mmetsp:Transcript_4127/g.14742  ORF Transcript_4127/g.14742 Transcript_4127/m.14742 type:complete len:218 (-) Transcript_4127:352-1005(-)
MPPPKDLRIETPLCSYASSGLAHPALVEHLRDGFQVQVDVLEVPVPEAPQLLQLLHLLLREVGELGEVQNSGTLLGPLDGVQGILLHLLQVRSGLVVRQVLQHLLPAHPGLLLDGVEVLLGDRVGLLLEGRKVLGVRVQQRSADLLLLLVQSKHCPGGVLRGHERGGEVVELPHAIPGLPLEKTQKLLLPLLGRWHLGLLPRGLEVLGKLSDLILIV